MYVEIHTQESSTPVVYHNALGTYQKCDMYCVFFIDKDGSRKVHKYPIIRLFRVQEDYSTRDHGAEPVNRIDE